jgi:ubiquinone/menaquinone biosynthesis C-methylase UbiE
MSVDRGEYLCFDRVADMYEATRYIPPHILTDVARLLSEDARLNSDQLFLDAGVGTGRFARYLHQQGVSVIGVDISATMLHHARKNEPALRLVCADLRSLPFPSKRFTCALMVHVLHLIQGWQQVVSEVRRVLVPNGSLYLGMESPKRFSTTELYYQLANERNLTLPNLGARSLDDILTFLMDQGAQIETLDTDHIRWNQSIRTCDLLHALHANPYSHLWHVPDQAHHDLMMELEGRVKMHADWRVRTETTPMHLSLWRVRWSASKEE